MFATRSPPRLPGPVYVRRVSWSIRNSIGGSLSRVRRLKNSRWTSPWATAARGAVWTSARNRAIPSGNCWSTSMYRRSESSLPRCRSGEATRKAPTSGDVPERLQTSGHAELHAARKLRAQEQIPHHCGRFHSPVGLLEVRLVRRGASQEAYPVSRRSL